MLDAKLYCVFFFWYFLSCTRKRSFYTLPCCGHQAMGLFSTFYCASWRFFCRTCFFFTKGEKQLHVNLLCSVLSETYIQHTLFASLTYTNWFISNQKLSSTLYTWSASVSRSVCAGAFGFIVVVNSFVVGLFLFWKPVTICHSVERCTCCGIIVNMKGCVKGPAGLKTASNNQACSSRFSPARHTIR